MTAVATDRIAPQRGPQENFLRSAADIVIFGGGAGGGKSYALLLEAARHVHNPNYGAVIFRRTYPQVMNEGGLWDTANGIYPHMAAKGAPSRAEFVFPKGSTVRFAHLEHDKNAMDWQGSQLAFIGFDELTHFSAYQFWYLLSRNRSTSGVRPYVRATTNPDADSWVAELISWWIGDDGFPIPERCGVLQWFVRLDNKLIFADDPDQLRAQLPDSFPVEAFAPKTLTFIPSLVTDNPALLRTNPEYMATLLSLPYVERERLLRGNWRVRAAAGNIFPPGCFRIIDAAPASNLKVRYWDKAASLDGARTAGVLLSYSPPGFWTVEESVVTRANAYERDRLIYQTAELDGRDIPIVVEQEGGSGGKESAENTIRQLAGWRVYAESARNDKVTRAEGFAAQAQAGNVSIVRGAWNRDYIDELNGFPEGRFMDQVDASSGGLNWLARRLKSGFTSSDFATIKR